MRGSLSAAPHSFDDIALTAWLGEAVTRRFPRHAAVALFKYLPIWHNPTSTLAPRSEAELRSDIVPSIRCPLGVGSETEGILKLR